MEPNISQGLLSQMSFVIGRSGYIEAGQSFELQSFTGGQWLHETAY